MGSTFIPSRCALIATRGMNALVRGNMPLLGEDLHFALDEIELAADTKLEGRSLYEYPIIDNVGERAQFVPLMKAFGVDPDAMPASAWPWWEHEVGGSLAMGMRLTTEGREVPGQVTWRPFEGLPEGADPQPYLHRPGWDFVGFVEEVDRQLTTTLGAVIYVHCQLGADRTGAFHAGFLLKQGYSLKDAMRIASTATTAGSPNSDYLRLVAAYAAELGQD